MSKADNYTNQQASKTEHSPKRNHNKRVVKIFLFSFFAILLAWTFREKFLREWEVEVTQAIVFPNTQKEASDAKTTEGTQGDLLLQATGWIEPDPFPIAVTSLYSGVVQNVHVLEGQKVKKGETIVSLIDEDAQLAYAEAKASLSQSQAKESEIKADIELAEASLEVAIANVNQGEIQLRESNDSLSRLVKLPAGAVAEQTLYQAKLAVEKQQSSLQSSNSEVKIQHAQISKLKQRLLAQHENSKVLEIKKQVAELDLNRTDVKSPVDGIVLRSMVKPGARLMLHMDDMDAGTAAILYEEGKLQARIDVPLNEVSKINLGQSVEITSSIFPAKVFPGKVTRILGEADLQRNTLQVKVSLLNPDPKLRPEMLCRAKFFDNGTSNTKEKQQMKIFVPQFVRSSNLGDDGVLWVLSVDGNHAEQRKVSFGTEVRESFIEITDGLRAGDKIILNPPPQIKEGDRVKVIKNQ